MKKLGEIFSRAGASAVVTAAVFLLILFGLTTANLAYDAPDISESERRPLAPRPPLTIQNKDGQSTFNWGFMDDFEEYALDSFVWRDGFRQIKANILWSVLRQKDNNGIYIVDGSAAEILTLDEKSVADAAAKIMRLKEAMLEGMNIYYSVIPDKGYYMGGQNGYPVVDYDRLLEIMEQGLDGVEYIDLLGVLDIDDYYATDLHWRQERLYGVVGALTAAMGAGYSLPRLEANAMNPFYGVYKGQAALPLPAEELEYLTGGPLEGAVVKYLDATTLEMVEGSMYYPELFDGIDPYEVFLKGAQPLITIENPNAASDRQLYIFRDSFSSSLAPLLCGQYAKITLIDLRYLASPAVELLVDFEAGSDVLFLYGMQILSDSSLLLVQ